MKKNNRLLKYLPPNIIMSDLGVFVGTFFLTKLKKYSCINIMSFQSLCFGTKKTNKKWQIVLPGNEECTGWRIIFKTGVQIDEACKMASPESGSIPGNVSSWKEYLSESVYRRCVLPLLDLSSDQVSTWSWWQRPPAAYHSFPVRGIRS